MFCKFCGKELADGTKFCSECGNSLDSATPIQPVRQEPAAPQPFQQAAYPPPSMGYQMPYLPPVKVGKTPAYWIGKAAVLFALFCFMMPFVRTSIRIISDHGKSYTGTYLMFDAPDDVDSRYIDRRDNTAYEVMTTIAAILWVAAILAVIALILPVGTSIFSILSSLVLLAFAAGCRAVEEELQDSIYYSGIHVRAQYGLYLAVALLITSVILMCMDSSIRRQKKRELMMQSNMIQNNAMMNNYNNMYR